MSIASEMVRTWPARRAARKAFLHSLREGDLIRWRGNLRLIRKIVERTAPGHAPKRTFVFAKLKCSRYANPVTTYTQSDLYTGDLELVGRNVKLKSFESMMVDKCVAQHPREPFLIEQCDVVGMTI